MKSRNKYLLKNIFSFFLGKMGSKLINFFLVPLYTHVFATEQYGTVDLVTTVATVLMPILILDIGESVMRFCLDKGADKSRVMSVGVSVLVFGAVAGLVIIPVSALVPQIRSFGSIVYFYVVSSAFAQVFLCYLRGQEKLNFYAVGNLLHTALVALLNIFYLVYLSRGIQGYFVANIIANFLTAGFAFVAGRAQKALKSFSFDKKLAKEMIKYSSVLIPTTFMWWIVNSSDRIMVTAMVGAAANGVYAVAYKIPTLLTSFSGIFNQAWSYSAIREEDSEDKTQYYNAVYGNMVQVLCIAVGGLFVVTKPFLKVFVAAEYYCAWEYMPFLYIGFMFMSLGTFLSAPYTVHKDSVAFLVSGSVGAVINVVLNFAFIPFFGVMGAAFATCVSYISVFLYRVFDVRRYVCIKVFRSKHIGCYLLLLLMGAASYIKNQWLCFGLLLILFCGVTWCSKDVLVAAFEKFKNKKSPW